MASDLRAWGQRTLGWEMAAGTKTKVRHSQFELHIMPECLNPNGMEPFLMQSSNINVHEKINIGGLANAM